MCERERERGNDVVPSPPPPARCVRTSIPKTVFFWILHSVFFSLFELPRKEGTRLKIPRFPRQNRLVIRLYFFHDFYAFHPLISYTGIPLSYRLSILPINNKWFACREGLSLVEMKPHPCDMLSPSHFLGVISGVWFLVFLLDYWVQCTRHYMVNKKGSI